MPTPFLHLPLAFEVAGSLRRDGHGIELPAFLFGSIAPDVAHQLDLPRAVTHLWSTSDDVSGALRLLALHSSLAAGSLTVAERSFVAGYLCHLIVDEQWTFCIWRPYFGRHSRYGGSAAGAAVQSAFRDALDTEAAATSPSSAELGDMLLQASSVTLREALLPFVSTHALHEARAAVAEQCHLPPGEARVRYWHTFKQRSGLPPPASSRAEQEDATTYVGRESREIFRTRSLEESLVALRNYFAGRPLQPPRGTQDPAGASFAASDASELIAT